MNPQALPITPVRAQNIIYKQTSGVGRDRGSATDSLVLQMPVISGRYVCCLPSSKYCLAAGLGLRCRVCEQCACLIKVSRGGSAFMDLAVFLYIKIETHLSGCAHRCLHLVLTQGLYCCVCVLA